MQNIKVLVGKYAACREMNAPSHSSTLELQIQKIKVSTPKILEKTVEKPLPYVIDTCTSKYSTDFTLVYDDETE